MGGLLLAMILQENAKDLRVDIYESSANLSELGVGIGMWPRMWEIMEYLGLDKELLELSGGHLPDGSFKPLPSFLSSLAPCSTSYTSQEQNPIEHCHYVERNASVNLVKEQTTNFLK